MTIAILTVRAEITPQAKDLISELGAIFQDVKDSLPENVLEVIKLIFNDSQILQSLLSVDSDVNAALTGETVVRFKPGDCLLFLVAAFRARDWDCLTVENFHKPSLQAGECGSVETPH